MHMVYQQPDDGPDTATPAPWSVIGGESYTIQNLDIDEIVVWEMGGIDNEANARLIAAAPDLLDTCEALGAFTRDLLKLLTPEQIKGARLTTRMLKLNDRAFNVIAKARGKH